MAIITDESKRHDMPHEPGQWVMLKKLSGAQMDEADQENTRKVMERLGPMMVTMQGLKPPDDDKPKTAQQELDARRSGFDPETLINYALVGWSYEADITDENVARLDAQTRDWLWSLIVEENTRPPAFVLGGGLS